mmetsp:Transcript_37520/g.76550  ORF Transcript_37520/g.76550 Transcript_37520/m.76550 type:complete len:85 (+) Transcript_37520:799-1053(+)
MLRRASLRPASADSAVADEADGWWCGAKATTDDGAEHATATAAKAAARLHFLEVDEGDMVGWGLKGQGVGTSTTTGGGGRQGGP